jgi:hypothetical protein
VKKLSIAIDMGAKNNGVFIAKTKNSQILDKKATCIIVDEKKINFSKKSRRENRHKDRNYKRRKLSKRLLKEVIDFDDYTSKEQELILGLLNNRGYTFISISTEFEKLNDETVEFINQYFEDLKDLVTKEDFENKISSFENLQDLKEFIKTINDKISTETKKKKNEFYKEFQSSFSKIIKKDLNQVKSLFNDVLKELDTGSKPRQKYLEEIKIEIEKDFDFIKEFSKIEFFNIIGNISNLQLRVLRKYFNNKFDNKLDISKLDDKVRKYFKAFHYKTDKEKAQREELFKAFGCHDNILDFLKSTNPSLTIPPYEDMNNRDTYKCNSMLIKPEFITDEIKNAIEYVLKDFDLLTIDQNGELKKEELHKIKVIKDNQKIKIDFTYSKYLQRILDATEDITTKELNPRNVFKHEKKFQRGTIDSVVCFQKAFGKDIYNTLKPIAKRYYEEESLIYGGIYEESNSIFVKCNVNTPYKNNAKHILLKPIYSYGFSSSESDEFIENIKNIRGLQKALQRVSDEAKKYQNSFYHVIEACFNNEKCLDDKEIKSIVKDVNKNFLLLKEILKDKDTCLNKIQKVEKDNLKRVINIFKQTYEILFKDLGGFNKTCKHCTSENSIRSDEKQTIAKRLLSDVAKPIDGMLDMMLDRLSFEIVQNISKDDIKDIDNLEILLEQNRFEFEESLNTIKRANNNQIKKYKNENKDRLNIDICPYNGDTISKGDWDHILPQSQGVYNSKANMIYCSTRGNQDKNNQNYTLENLSSKHLKAIFKTNNLEEIKDIIKKGINSINKNDFTNFDNLTLHQQVALRYALFMRNTSEFNKAFELVKLDKIKTITNGTQKRLARFVYEKLTKKFPKEFENIKVNSKTVDNKLVSSTRNMLSVDNHTLKKQEIQDSHSHCIDAMVVYHLENDNIGFGEVYVDSNNNKEIQTQQWYNTTNQNYKIESKKLFDENDISVGYLQIRMLKIIDKKGKEKLVFKKGIIKSSFVDFTMTLKTFDYFKFHKIFENKKDVNNEIIDNEFIVNKTNLYDKLFNNKNEVLDNLSNYKNIEDLRYTYTSVSPFEFTDKFLNPSTSEDKKAVEKIINKLRPNLNDMISKNLMAWYSRSNKLDKNGAKLGYYKSWEIFADILEKNKDTLFTEIEKAPKKGEPYKHLVLNHGKALELCKKTLFKQTHTKKRDKKKNAYTLYSASKNDTQYIHRRQIGIDENKKPIYIYQTRIANGHDKLKGYKKAFSDNGKYFFSNSKNIIPLTIGNYKKAFGED